MTNRGVGDRVGLGGVGLFVGGRVYLQAVSEKQLWPFMLIVTSCLYYWVKTKEKKVNRQN
jgi:hypothetical protein